MKKRQPRFLYQSIWGPLVTEKVKRSETCLKIFTLVSTTHLYLYRTKVRDCSYTDTRRGQWKHLRTHPVTGFSKVHVRRMVAEACTSLSPPHPHQPAQGLLCLLHLHPTARLSHPSKLSPLTLGKTNHICV